MDWMNPVKPVMRGCTHYERNRHRDRDRQRDRVTDTEREGRMDKS